MVQHEQNVRTYDEDRIMLYGQPFIFSLSTTPAATGYATAVLLTLDGAAGGGADYVIDLDGDGNLEQNPFSGQELYITAIRIANDTLNVFGGLQIDGKLVLTGSILNGGGMLQHIAGQHIYLDAMAKNAIAPPVPAATAQELYGSPLRGVFKAPLLARNTIRLWAAVSGQANATVLWLRGFNIPRRV